MLSGRINAKPLIVSHIKCGRFQHALDLYITIQSDVSYYIPLDGPTFVALLKACAKVKDSSVGSLIHAEVSRVGLLQKNVFIGSAVVDMYAKCGLISRAKQVFNKLQVRDVISWTSLIAGYSEHRHGEEALKVFEQMQVEGITPNIVTFICCLKACGNVGAIEKGLAIHAEVARQGLVEKDNFIGNCIISMYSKCGFFNMAHEVLNDLLVQDVVSWTAIITGYTEQGYNEAALECFEQMQLEGISPNVITFICSLKACGSTRALEKGQKVHEEIHRRGLMLTENTIIGSMLVYMYAKCSCIAEAKQVFDTLPIRVLDSWNALIGGYADHDLGKEALDCFQRMLCEVVSPNAITFIYILRACCSIGAKDKGRERHIQVEENKLLEGDSAIGNTLVDMYAKCGLLALAQDVFDKLINQDVVSWTTLIAGYADYGYDFEALKCFEQMDVVGVAPNVATYICCLKVYGNIGAIDEGEAMHIKIEKLGLLEGDLSTGNALVRMYAKCRILTAAQGVFDRLLVRDIISWTLLIQGYAECDRTQEVLQCLELMKLEGFSPNAFTYSCSLKSCDDIGILWKLHTEIEKQCFLESDLALGNMLVSLYAKTGSLNSSQQLFDRLQVQNVVSWSTIMEGHVIEGSSEKVFAYFQLMQVMGVYPDVVTFICMLKACGNLGDAKRGQEIHAEVERRGLFEINLGIGNIVMEMYIQCGLLPKALQVFEKLPFRNEVSWNTLIAGYSELGHSMEAIKCFEVMLQEGIFPSIVSFVCVLKASNYCIENLKLGALELHYIEDLLLERGIHIGNAMVIMHAKSGFLAKAAEVFDKIPFQDIISWNSVITACGSYGYSEDALEYFEQMTLVGMSPDVITFFGVLKACGDIGATQTGQKIHADIERRGFLQSDLISSAIVSMYAKCGLPSEARKVFEKLPFRDIVTWTALLAGYAQIGDSMTVIYNFEIMLREGIEPDSIAFFVVLSACSHTCLVHKCYTYLEDMSKQYGIVPTHDHYACLIDLLAHTGQLDNAILLAKKMPIFRNPLLLHTLLKACKHWGNFGFGQHVFESAVYYE